MFPGNDKIQILIDGTNYIDDLGGDIPFLPVIERDKDYHSVLATFGAVELEFASTAYAYMKDIKESRGPFASSTFLVKFKNQATGTYRTAVSGSIDYNTWSEDVVNSTVKVLFRPDDANDKVKNRDDVQTKLQELFDFDGSAITSFTSAHGETYTLSLTKTEIAGLTEIGTSNCEVMLAWEVFLRLAQKILGKNDALRSDLLGRKDSSVFTSLSDGRRAFIAFTNGGLIRGGTISDYPITISLREAFEAINQIEPIGLGIEYISGVPFMRVEAVDYFYNNTSDPVWTITRPETIGIETNSRRVYGKVFSGYRVFDKSSDTGYILSPHTERSWVTGLDGISNEEYNCRTNIATSSYLIEIVRNNVISNNSSDEMDNQNFMIQTKRNGASDFQLDNDYVDVNGTIDNPTTQKNYTLMPGRCIQNHLKLINAALIREYRYRLANEVGFSEFRPILYQTGQGNDDAQSQLNGESALISEDADLLVGDGTTVNEPIYYEDDLIVEVDLPEETYIDLITDQNINIWVPITYNSVTRYGFIDRIEFLSISRVRCIFKWANENY